MLDFTLKLMQMGLAWIRGFTLLELQMNDAVHSQLENARNLDPNLGYGSSFY
jgi:hypothetical protein